MIGTRRALLYLLLVFLLGFALGSLGTVWADRNDWLHGRWSKGYFSTRGGVDWLNRELNLTPEQQKQLETILDETAAGYQAIRKRVGPEYDQVRQAGRDRIRAILTPEQRTRFEELVRQIDERRARSRFQRDEPRREAPKGNPR